MKKYILLDLHSTSTSNVKLLEGRLSSKVLQNTKQFSYNLLHIDIFLLYKYISHYNWSSFTYCTEIIKVPQLI